jgi:hypothetical protein
LGLTIKNNSKEVKIEIRVDMEKWNELCFILKESLPLNATEQLFELKVIQAFEKLGWSEFRNEIVVRESIQLGASNRVSPDLVFKSSGQESLFIVEVKKPSIDINNLNFKNQLSSYIGLLRLELGVLIGNKIQMFLDGKQFNKSGLFLFEEIEFERNSQQGNRFVELFQQDNFNLHSVKDYAALKIQELKESEMVETLKKQLLSKNANEAFVGAIKSHLLKVYPEKVIDRVLSKIEFGFTNKSSFVDADSHKGTKVKNSSSTIKGSQSSPAPPQVRIGKFVMQSLVQLIDDNRISNDEVKNLQSLDYSKQAFKIPYAFLKPKHRLAEKERVRYWKNPINIRGEEFFVCSQWVENSIKNHRPYFEGWLARLNQKD